MFFDWPLLVDTPESSEFGELKGCWWREGLGIFSWPNVPDEGPDCGAGGQLAA